MNISIYLFSLKFLLKMIRSVILSYNINTCGWDYQKPYLVYLKKKTDSLIDHLECNKLNLENKVESFIVKHYMCMIKNFISC